LSDDNDGKYVNNDELTTPMIEGDTNDLSRMGIVPRSMTALFDAASERAEAIEFNFRVSYIEIYMEKVKDLLADQVASLTAVHVYVYMYI
jgi:hypothetical protein